MSGGRDLVRHRQLFDEAVRTNGQFNDEARIGHRLGGQPRWLQIRGRVVADEDGKPLRMSGLSFDMTERKAMEEALRESDRRKDEFLAMLAHELRNPLAPIRNSAELLARLDLSERARRAADVIARQERQLARMVDDLLDVSRLTRGRIEIERRPVDLAAIVGAAVEAVEPAIREREHTLSVTSGLPLIVKGDSARLQQCVVNLLTNAAKYTDRGGHIEVTLGHETDHANVTVTDNGSGIAPEMLPVVFDLFVQSERTLDRAQGGLGIGLSVVRRLVEMHGGSVTAASAGVGHGSTFRIRLPLLAKASLAAEKQQSTTTTPRRVMVVDDNQDAAESLAILLRMDGHSVLTVLHSEKALDAAQEFRPDVVFLDIGMPGMDGYEVARRLRAEAMLAQAQLYALTGYGQPGG